MIRMKNQIIPTKVIIQQTKLMVLVKAKYLIVNLKKMVILVNLNQLKQNLHKKNLMKNLMNLVKIALSILVMKKLLKTAGN